MQAPSGAVGQLAKRERGAKTHCCSSCNFPIAAYGRCAPCLHVFCLACAADMATCRICTAPITKLEPVQRGAGQLFVSPATLQGFRTEADFTKHVAHVKQSLPAHRPPAS